MAEGLASEYWVNILEREGWLVINVEDRKLGIVISNRDRTTISEGCWLSSGG